MIAVTAYGTNAEKEPYQGWIWTLRPHASPGWVSPARSDSMIGPSVSCRVSREPVYQVSLVLALWFWTWQGWVAPVGKLHP